MQDLWYRHVLYHRVSIKLLHINYTSETRVNHFQRNKDYICTKTEDCKDFVHHNYINDIMHTTPHIFVSMGLHIWYFCCMLSCHIHTVLAFLILGTEIPISFKHFTLVLHVRSIYTCICTCRYRDGLCIVMYLKASLVQATT